MMNQEIRDAYFDLENKVTWESDDGIFQYYDADGLFVFRDKLTGLYLFIEADNAEEAFAKIDELAEKTKEDYIQWCGSMPS